MRLLEEFWYGNIEPTEYDTLPLHLHRFTIVLL